jgi:hypothetical protein
VPQPESPVQIGKKIEYINHNYTKQRYIFTRTKIIKHLPPVAYLFLGILYLWSAVSRSIFVERDLAPFFIPPRYLWVTLVQSFQLPLWNPYNYSGMPILATLQPGILYPPNLFFLFLPFPFAWNWLIILHFAFVGSTTYYFLRYLKTSTLASFAGGVIFMLSGYLLSVHNLLPHLLAVGWFPLVLLYFIKHYETGRYRHLVLTGIFLVIEFLAGAPEVVMLTCFVLLIIALYPSPFLYGDQLGWFGRIKPFFILLVLFLFLSAVQSISFYELKLQSIRSAGLSYKEATTWSLSWRDFLLFFLPDAFGYAQTTAKYWSNQSWLKTIYIGVIPFVMSLFFFCSKDGKKLIFVIFMAVSLFFALGENNPLYQFLYHIPPFNAIRYPVKFLFLFFFTIAVTAAFGFDKLKAGLMENDKRVKCIVALFFYVGFIFAGFWGYLNLFDANVRAFLDVHKLKPEQYNEIWFNLHNLKRFLFFSFLFCVALLAYLRAKLQQKKYVLFGIIILLTVDLFLANYGYYQTVSWKKFISEHKFASTLSKARETERYFVTEKTHTELGKYFPTDKAILNAPYAPLFGFYTIQGIEILRIAHHDLFLNMLLGANALSDAKRYINIAGVRFMITSYEIDDHDFQYRDRVEIEKGAGYLYEYMKYPGRYLLYGSIQSVKDDNAMIKKMLDRSVDLRKELIIVEDSKFKQWPSRAVKGKVSLISYKANKVILESDTDNDAFLYVSDTYYPGWRAYVDGKETKIYRANLAFRAVEVPKGKHTVVFKYVPMSFYIGLCLTIFGILLCIYLWRRDRTAVNRESQIVNRG